MKDADRIATLEAENAKLQLFVRTALGDNLLRYEAGERERLKFRAYTAMLSMPASERAATFSALSRPDRAQAARFLLAQVRAFVDGLEPDDRDLFLGALMVDQRAIAERDLAPAVKFVSVALGTDRLMSIKTSRRNITADQREQLHAVGLGRKSDVVSRGHFAFDGFTIAKGDPVFMRRDALDLVLTIDTELAGYIGDGTLVVADVPEARARQLTANGY